MSITALKRQIRCQLRQARRNLTTHQQQSAAKSCAQIIIQSELLTNSSKFAIYLANDGELDPQPLINYLWQQEKEVYLPVMDGKNLFFSLYQAESTLVRNQYGLQEPSDAQICPLEQLDIIFLPLVAFDNSGQRLGRGGGFYDRTLSNNLKAKTIGLAHQFQLQRQLPCESWDEAIHAVATPENLYLMPSQQKHKF